MSSLSRIQWDLCRRKFRDYNVTDQTSARSKYNPERGRTPQEKKAYQDILDDLLGCFQDWDTGVVPINNQRSGDDDVYYKEYKTATENKIQRDNWNTCRKLFKTYNVTNNKALLKFHPDRGGDADVKERNLEITKQLNNCFNIWDTKLVPIDNKRTDDEAYFLEYKAAIENKKQEEKTLRENENKKKKDEYKKTVARFKATLVSQQLDLNLKFPLLQARNKEISKFLALSCSDQEFKDMSNAHRKTQQDIKQTVQTIQENKKNTAFETIVSILANIRGEFQLLDTTQVLRECRMTVRPPFLPPPPQQQSRPTAETFTTIKD